MDDEDELVAIERIGIFNPEGREDVEDIKSAARRFIKEISRHCPDGRRKSKALTDVETAAMYAVKSLFEG